MREGKRRGEHKGGEGRGEQEGGKGRAEGEGGERRSEHEGGKGGGASCFDQTGGVQGVLHMQALWQRQLRKVCSRQQGGPSAAGGDQV